jgi:crotonobetainyl-CoA:carnitine CoA-transferase CaiB-like acyl-CoA transferase
MYLSGRPGEPTKAYVPWVDFGTATHAAFATVAALYARKSTGRGQHVEASLLRTALTVSNAPLIEQRVRKLDRVATGNRSQIAGPSDSFRTQDGWILAQVIGQPLFERWCRLVGERLPRRSALRERSARGEHGAILSERMALVRRAHDAAALAELEAASIPPVPCTRRNRPSTIHMFAKRESCARSTSPACRSPRRSPTRPCASPRAALESALARRSSASTPTRSCAASDTMPTRSRRFAGE